MTAHHRDLSVDGYTQTDCKRGSLGGGNIPAEPQQACSALPGKSQPAALTAQLRCCRWDRVGEVKADVSQTAQASPKRLNRGVSDS